MNITKLTSNELTSNELQAELNLNAFHQMEAYMKSDVHEVARLQVIANQLRDAIEGMVAA